MVLLDVAAVAAVAVVAVVADAAAAAVAAVVAAVDASQMLLQILMSDRKPGTFLRKNNLARNQRPMPWCILAKIYLH